MTLAQGFAAFCLLAALTPAPVMAADGPPVVFYRYVDSHGVTVLDRQGVPPDYVAKGYEVLNAQGRVVQTVPPALSAEQVRQQQAASAQAAAESQLLHQYPSLDEIDRARDHRLAEVDGLVALASGNLQTLKGQQDSLQAQAADLERNGQPVPQQLMDQIKGIQGQRSDVAARIVNYQAIRQQVSQQFAQDRARLAKLLEN
ncbi:hypothetical protein PMM47T1_06116 [Pseudomonas sp. M47T1]|nr:hypothetical protein [Pseudomonas sp. M47T1]EIK97336.1 hypothetical protein PMM47T1_06116 [Pseudomonas sp. M47T1]